MCVIYRYSLKPNKNKGKLIKGVTLVFVFFLIVISKSMCDCVRDLHKMKRRNHIGFCEASGKDKLHYRREKKEDYGFFLCVMHPKT